LLDFTSKLAEGVECILLFASEKSHFVESQTDMWLELNDLGLSPDVSFFLKGVITKAKGFVSFNVACKWQRRILGVAPKSGWFILPNLETLESAIAAYKRREDIEEMFRDFKSGGYNLEDTNVSDERLTSMILLIAIAYTSATLQGQQIKRKGVTMNPDILTEPSFALMSRCSKVGWVKGSVKMSEFFVGVQEYVGRVQEYGRIERRHSSFYIGL